MELIGISLCNPIVLVLCLWLDELYMNTILVLMFGFHSSCLKQNYILYFYTSQKCVISCSSLKAKTSFGCHIIPL